MGLEEFQRMPLRAEGLRKFAIATRGFDPEILDEIAESLHGLAGVQTVESNVLHEPLDSVAHDLAGKVEDFVEAMRLEEKPTARLAGKVGVFVEIHAVGAGGAFRFRCGLGFHAPRGGDFCSFQKWGIMQGV